jgi:hypothetical protein
MKNTPELIIDLEPNQIFVFGSNLQGRHGKFSAKTAMKWGAKYGQAEGRQGQTYAIPTIKTLSPFKILPLDDIKLYVYDFIRYAAAHPEFDFLVIKIGCGSAGYKPKQIAPFFESAKLFPNIILPYQFEHKIENI